MFSTEEVLSTAEVLENLSNLPMIRNMMSGEFFTAAVKNNIWSFLWFIVAYSIVFIVIPSKILGLKLCDGNFFDNALTSIIVSQTSLTFVVFVLAFMKIYNLATLIIALIIGIMYYYKFRDKISYREKANEVIYKLADLITGQRKLSLIIIPRYRRFVDSIANGIKYFVKFFFNKNVVFHIICTGSIIVLTIRRFFFAMESEGFPTSDVTVHTSWVNFIDAGYIFSDGIYPFAMHNIVSAFAKLTGIDVVTVMRFIGPWNAIMMGLMLMVFISRIFKSPAAATITALVYCVSSFGSGAVIDRVYFSLPQEFGMFYIFPAAYFLVKFLEENENMDGVTFAMAASMTVSAHFYNAIFAVPLCICVAIPYIPSLIKKRDMLVKTGLTLILAAFIALSPFAVGRIMGYNWQGSLDWAVSMMSGVSSSKDDSSDQTEEVQEEVQEEPQVVERGPSFIEKSINSFGWTARSYTYFWGRVVLWSSLIGALLGVGLLFTEHKMAGKVAIGLGLNMAVFNYCLLHAGYFGLPSLIGGDRALNYLIYIGAVMIGVPFGAFWCFFENKLKPVRWVGSVAIVTAFACLIFYTGNTFESSAYYRMSYSSVTENYYKIKNTHRKNTWTIVSTVDELSLTRNKGWHYELWEFVFSMEQYDSTRVVQIPTEYVYFVVEKRPLKYNEHTYLGDPLEIYGRVNASYANQLLTEQTLRTSRKSDYYSDYEIRRAIMSKAYFWAERYMQYFPDQMRVYYDDQNIVIYEIHQNMFALNNFAIDYGYNTMTYDEWLLDHPEFMEEDETVSDSDLVVSDSDLTDEALAAAEATV